MTRQYHDLPHLFVVPHHGGHRGYTYECHRIDWQADGGPPVYDITPCNLETRIPCIVRPEQTHGPYEHVTRVRIRRPQRSYDSWYNGDFLLRWRFTEYVALHLPDGLQMPLIDVVNVEELQQTAENCIWLEQLGRGRGGAAGGAGAESDSYDSSDDEVVRRRRRRMERHASPTGPRRRPAPAAPAAAPPQPQRQPQRQPPPPKFVTDALVRDAVATGAICPITMEPLTTDTAAVTTCFHIFEGTAIASWLAQDIGHTCPVCKQTTAIAAAGTT